MAGICRLCLFVVRDCVTLYDYDNQLLEMIKAFLPLSEAWSESRALPIGVCARCAEEIRRAHAFFSAAAHTQFRLLAALEADDLFILYRDLRAQLDQIKQEAEDNKEDIIHSEEDIVNNDKDDIVNNEEEGKLNIDEDYKRDLTNTISDNKRELNNSCKEIYDFSSDDDRSLVLLRSEEISVKASVDRKAHDKQKHKICNTSKKKYEEELNNSCEETCHFSSDDDRSLALLRSEEISVKALVDGKAHNKQKHKICNPSKKQYEEELNNSCEETYDFSSDDDRSLALLRSEEISVKALVDGKAHNKQKHKICNPSKKQYEEELNNSCEETYDFSSDDDRSLALLRSEEICVKALVDGEAHKKQKHKICNSSKTKYEEKYKHGNQKDPVLCLEDLKYKCEECGKRYNLRKHFEKHKNIHTGEKPFACTICPQSFHFSQNLTRHSSQKHGVVPKYQQERLARERAKLARERAELAVARRRRRRLCDLCGLTLSNNDHLKRHRLVHFGIKNHACKTCGKAYVLKCNMEVHERVHSGEKPYGCAECGKAFSQRSTLVVHLRSHTGERPFRCNRCRKRFVARGLLTQHKRLCC